MPECRTGGGGHTNWFDTCGAGRICEAACTDCTVACGGIGTADEGWYATCTDPGVDGGCDDTVANLIQRADCG